jgi:uncharacterized protein YyaL (SSP411 family)
MKFIYLVLLFLFFTQIAFANDLKYETSPYLRQHDTNAVNWHAWSEKTFTLAKQENKPIYVSIGYSTCHWCHKMSEESFDNEEIAKLLNKYFICIKVDKEEMPHIDSKYQALHKKVNNYPAGWPINIFMSNKKEVFYMSGYIPPYKTNEYKGLDTLVPYLYNKYKNHKLDQTIEKIKKMSKDTKVVSNKKITKQTLINSINNDWDDLSAGFGGTSKFPEASKIHLMIDLGMDDKAIEMLNTMAMRGLYDHVDGGFFRYSTDVDWEIPHFEKMLYNQAELISLYSRAYKLYKKQLYKDVVIESIAMINKFFLKDDLYFSASDAVVNKNEGEYYIFNISDIKTALSKNKYKKELHKALYSCIDGNFKSYIHLNFQTNTRPKGYKEFINELKKIRVKKQFPFVDKKINTAWNSLIIEALLKASFIDVKYKKQAQKSLTKLNELMFYKGRLHHQTIGINEPSKEAFLEDYAFMISALLSEYKVSNNAFKLEFAKYLLENVYYNYYRDGVWYGDEQRTIKADLIDIHYVSALGKMLQNLHQIYKITSNEKYRSLFDDSMKTLKGELQKYQANKSSLARVYLKVSIYRN